MEFEDFFEAIHGCSPFPWQAEIARRLCAGQPPAAIAIPTGCGKTAVIDAALYHAAHGGPRRIFFIIDRRVVVDEAYLRTERMRKALVKADSGSLAKVARQLGDIQVVRLRGGVHTDESWPWYPDQTTVVLSTVDQVGSRLLHRGYGVSPRMWPVHAGFVGNDALYLVDEAHISRAFVTTVRAAAKHGADVRLIQLSATLGDTEGDVLTLSERDRQVPILRRRLEARKAATMETVPAADNQFVPVAVERAAGVAEGHGPGAVVGVVVNQVRTARRIFERLCRQGLEATLLTGRVRPYDRERTLDELLPRIRAGRERGKDGLPLFVVATQTVEVGADLDFDALVTEAAPLSALRQRFGRVDRLGERGTGHSHILGRDKFLQEKDPPKAPVYGEDLRHAWRWLTHVAEEGGGINFGPDAMAALLEASPPPEESVSHCPQLLAAHVERLAQTGPDAPPMDPSPWLHGPSRPYREVSVVWRADLNPQWPERWRDHVVERPPQTGEALPLPIHLFRELLIGKGRGDTSDLEGVDAAPTRAVEELPEVLRWRGRDDVERVNAEWVKPGDTLILPASWGGCDSFGWASDRNGPVEDIADACAFARDDRSRPFILRVHPAVDDWIPEESRPTIHEMVQALRRTEHDFSEEEGPDEEAIDAAWQALRAGLAELNHPQLLDHLGPSFSYRWLPDGWLVLRREGLEDSAERGAEAGTAVSLDAHSKGVAELAGRLAADDPERERLVIAAEGHDQGKRVHGFQILLHGDPVRAAAGPMLAKSGLRGRRARQMAWERSGLPRGFRHELCSLDYLENDDPLIKYLVASHHGHGRPWYPPLQSNAAPGAERVHLAGRYAALFATLLRELGPWRLAGLELSLRAADIRRSIEEAKA